MLMLGGPLPLEVFKLSGSLASLTPESGALCREENCPPQLGISLLSKLRVSC